MLNEPVERTQEHQGLSKNIILLSDGTGNSAAKIWRTNVWRVFEALDLNEVARDVLELTRSDFLVRRISVTTHMAPALPPIDGDRVQLQQVLLNLVLNACESMNANDELKFVIGSREAQVLTPLSK